MYTLTETSMIQRNADGAMIPRDEGNVDYRTYLQWVADGNEPTPYTPPPPTIHQIRAECQRRIVELTGSTDIFESLAKQVNALTRVVELNKAVASGQTLTVEEEAEIVEFNTMTANINELRNSSNVLEAAPLTDYKVNDHWQVE